MLSRMASNMRQPMVMDSYLRGFEPDPEEVETEADAEAVPALTIPMVEFTEVEVLSWLNQVSGLTPDQLVAVRREMAKEEYNGLELSVVTERRLRRLMRGTVAEKAVPLLLVLHCSYHLAPRFTILH